MIRPLLRGWKPRHGYPALWSGLALGLALVITALTGLAPSVDKRLDPNRLTLRAGLAFEMALGALTPFPFAVTGDGLYSPEKSSLEVLEDGRPLGPAHSPHQRVETSGGGAYSHWGNALVLSTSDGSDPRSNGREYRIRAAAQVSPALWWLLLTVTAAAAYLLVYHSDPRRFRGAFIRLDDGSGWGWMAAFGLACTAVAALLLLRHWEAAHTVGVSAAGFFPLSDAAGYWNCAAEIAGRGELTPNDWCSKRLIYTTFLAALLGLTNWHPHLMYVAQALVVGLAVAALALQAARLTGLAGGVLAGFLLLAYANDHALGVTMTEVAGLTAGTAGLALLLHGAEHARPLSIATGLALLSIAQVSRSGAMLILPSVFLWVVLMAPRLGLRRWPAVGMAMLALSSGFLLQNGLAQSLHVTSGASFGNNFSMTLYGLSVGGKGWNQVYKDHPEIYADVAEPNRDPAAPPARPQEPSPRSLAEQYRQVYTLALANIRAAPEVFLGAYLHAAEKYPRDLFAFAPWHPQSWWYLKGLFLLGLAWCLWRWRSPVSLLLLAMIVGEAVSAPLIIEDGGIRLFAGSIGVRVLLVALGLRAVTALLWPRQTTRGHEAATHSGLVADRPLLALTAGALLIGLAILPATGLLNFAKLPAVAGPACPPGEEPLVTRIDRESPTLTIAGDGQAGSIFPLVVRQKPLLAGMDGEFFAGDFAALKPGATLVNAIRREPLLVGKASGLFLTERPAWLTPGTLIRACVAPNDTVSIASSPYLRVRSLEPMATQAHGGQRQGKDSQPQVSPDER